MHNRPTVDDIMLNRTVQRAVFKYSFHKLFNRVVRTTVTNVTLMLAVTNVDLVIVNNVCVLPHSNFQASLQRFLLAV